MELTNYFSNPANWSVTWAFGLLTLLWIYMLYFRPATKKLFAAVVGTALLFMATGSPIARMLDFGLHSVAMFQHVVVLMLAPIFIWMAMPGKGGRANHESTDLSTKRISVITCWLAGTVTMWMAHFTSAAKLAAKTGLSICGIQAGPNSWTAEVPNALLLALLFVAGIIFLIPVFSRREKWRLSPLAAVIYLFAACVSCSILGLYVAFSANSAEAGHAASYLTTLRSPLPLSFVADQELAGMIMWVPGCVLYVVTSAHIALEWLDHPNARSNRDAPSEIVGNLIEGQKT